MTQEQFVNILEGAGIPVRYDHGENGLKVPFIFYTFVKGPALNADNKTYIKKNIVEVNILTDSKSDMNAYTDILEGIFDANDIPWGDPSEGWDDDEKIYLTTYNMEVNFNG